MTHQTQEETAFKLPMHTMFSIRYEGDSVIAHALDFDIVAVGKNEAQAVAKLRTAVKHYIEYGLHKGRDSSILFSAPEEFWASITPESRISIGEDLQIDHVRMITQITGGSTTTHEPELVAQAA